MRVALIGPELEENLGLRYMAASLERAGHAATIMAFNEEADTANVAREVLSYDPQIVGLSMVFTSRAREFCRLARALREAGYSGHLTAGGHFAALNCQRLLTDFPDFDSVALGEGEELICALATGPPDLSELSGFCWRTPGGAVELNLPHGNPEDLDLLPFPRRDTFHEHFGQPIASILSSRGCWRNCAFCSISAWYRSGGGRNFRIRSVPNIVAEMAELYHGHGVRVFNFQDDNFFLPDSARALDRFTRLRDSLRAEGVTGIAIAVKARPDSITPEAMAVLDDLGVFRVFLGVENASERVLRNLGRKCSREAIESALRILNDLDIHVAFNLLLFEPDTTMDDLLVNLRFMERHVDNPFNFCRAEAYAGTGLERKLRTDGILRGDYFGFDYRIKDARVEAFHQIANFAFFDRNFNDYGLHYFNMEVDFSFQLQRRFSPQVLSEGLRSEVRSFIKETNLDTYRNLSRIYDVVQAVDPADSAALRAAMQDVRERVDEAGTVLRDRGERVLDHLRRAHAERAHGRPVSLDALVQAGHPRGAASPYLGVANLLQQGFDPVGRGFIDPFPGAIPYERFRELRDQEKQTGG
jgi:anaerobic magnesium-protoporphyrin IX monomethyl ester cyclase